MKPYTIIHAAFLGHWTVQISIHYKILGGIAADVAFRDACNDHVDPETCE